LSRVGVKGKNMRTQIVGFLASFLVVGAEAQNILFSFDDLAAHSGLPTSYSVGGINASFSSTGQGFSIQAANVLGFTPFGFSGNCIYPNSVFAADLIASFSTPITDFSILYSPEEYACDSSATMRVTAYLNGTLAGTATTNAQAGTWPTETLRFANLQGFNYVVIHYDAAPVTGGDYGPVFMADNMMVTPAPPPIILTGAVKLSNGAFQFGFTNAPGGTNTVLVTTNLARSQANWTVLGVAAEISSGQYQFTDLQATNSPNRYYVVRSP
jgi:hypothetical protein